MWKSGLGYLAVAALAWSSTAGATTFDLTWQARVLDSNGSAVEGTHQLTLNLYNESGSSLWTNTYSGVALAGGYASLTLTGVNSDWFAGTVQIGITLDSGTELSPRQTLASVPSAQVARSVPVETGLSGCTQKGAMAFDDDADVLRVCDGTGWTSGGFALATAACGSASRGAIRWTGTALEACVSGTTWTRLAGAADGSTPSTASSSCAVLHADLPSLLSGPYYVDPSGSSPIQVYCDMSFETGGWTLVIKHSQSGIPNTSAAWVISDMDQLAVTQNAKLSDVDINAMTWTEWRIERVGDSDRHVHTTNNTQFNVAWPTHHTGWSSGTTDNGRNQEWCYYSSPAFGTQCSTLANTNTYGVSPHEGGLGGMWIHGTTTSGGALGGWSCGFGNSAETNCPANSGANVRHWVR